MSDDRRPTVLFVDDEQAILDGLQNSLRKYRKRWNLVFALGGREAIDVLAVNEVDVIVSDMRMPGMDGAELLTWAKDNTPAAVRIVLSGQAARETVERAMPVVHQYLAKPCDTARLASILERTEKFCSTITEPCLREGVGRFATVPTAPGTRQEVLDELDRPGLSLRQMTDVVAANPSLATSVLQVANLDYFGDAATITSIPRAVNTLGIDTIVALAHSMHWADCGPVDQCGCGVRHAGRDRSVVRAELARSFAPDPVVGETAFAAALLSKVGRLFLASACESGYHEVLRTRDELDRCLHPIERQFFGVDDADVAAHTLGMWGLPEIIVDAIGRQYDLDPAGATPLRAVLHAADVLSREVCSVDGCAECSIEMNTDFIEAAGCLGEVDRWRRTADEVQASRQAAGS
jgi:HD-like signal output (HDOD) protein/ActR/RegA family two-component response regulator